MAVYAIYSYEIQEGSKSLFYKDTGTKAIDMANEIIDNLLNDGLTVVGQKRKQDLTLTNLNFKGADGVFLGSCVTRRTRPFARAMKRDRFRNTLAAMS